MSRATKGVITALLIPILILIANKYFVASKTSFPISHLNQTISTTAPESPNTQCHMNGQLPDANCTPGVINPDVTQANVMQTICVKGYTKTIRPAAKYTDQLKRQQMQAYGFSDSVKLHEEDHLISLELGGAPTDPKNLWPEPGASPNPKDKVENFLHAAVCSGKIPLHDAQARITQNWATAAQGL